MVKNKVTFTIYPIGEQQWSVLVCKLLTAIATDPSYHSDFSSFQVRGASLYSNGPAPMGGALKFKKSPTEI